jgi:hypothetical protein
MTASIPFIFLAALFLYRAPALSGSGVTDPDYYWHLGYGEWILENGRLPNVDFWSWTFDGHSYRLTQWLGEVVMALAHQLGGEVGTSTLAALLATLAMAASYRTARCFLDNRLAALAVAVGCNAILVSLACRPHQFTHLGLALLTWIVASYQTTGNRKTLYWIPPLMAAWVNLHGGYAFGLTYLGMIVSFMVIDAYVRRDTASLRATVLPLCIATGAGFAATLLNPYGWGAWQYAIEIAGMKSASAGIVDEWAATNIKTDVGLNFFIVTSAMCAAMALTRRRPLLTQVFTALALIALGWSAVRLSLMVTVLMVPLVAAALRDTAFYDLVFDGDGRKYDRSFSIGRALATVVAVFAISISVAKLDQTTARHVTAKMPEAEVAFLRTNHVAGRILNAPEIGGYLIRKLGAKVSIDTRLDLYGDRALFEYLFAMRADAGWKDYIAKLDPDVVLINNPAALRQVLADSGLYRPVFEGAAYTILIRQNQYLELPTIELGQPSASVLSQLKS